MDGLSKSELEDLVDECESEACVVEDPDDELLCEQAQNLAELCRSEYGIAVDGWREKKFCGKRFGENTFKHIQCGI